MQCWKWKHANVTHPDLPSFPTSAHIRYSTDSELERDVITLHVKLLSLSFFSPLTSPHRTGLEPTLSYCILRLFRYEGLCVFVSQSAVVETSDPQYAVFELCDLIRSIHTHQVEQDTSRWRHANSFIPLRWCDTDSGSCWCRSDSYPPKQLRTENIPVLVCVSVCVCVVAGIKGCVRRGITWVTVLSGWTSESKKNKTS